LDEQILISDKDKNSANDYNMAECKPHKNPIEYHGTLLSVEKSIKRLVKGAMLKNKATDKRILRRISNMEVQS
jgi:hypothetical protein